MESAMKRLLAVGVAVLVTTSFARADVWCGTTKQPGEVPLWINGSAMFKTGNKLYDDCEAPDSSYFQGGACTGYIMGVADVLQAQNTNGLCLPSNVIVRQLVDVVK